MPTDEMTLFLAHVGDYNATTPKELNMKRLLDDIKPPVASQSQVLRERLITPPRPSHSAS